MARGDRRDQYDDDGRRHMRYLVVGLIAVIIGLVAAIVILAGSDNGSNQTGSETPAIPTRPADPNDDSGGVTPEPEPEPEPEPDNGGSTPDGGGSGSSGGVSPGGTSGGTGSGGIGP